ncbi:MAG TPA: VanZ family protein [Thermoanaerobaculia bacterium]|nr:VanZ family protein [Thermoanaerobaculia bacterium]
MRLLKLWLPVILWAAVILSSSNDAFSSDHSGEWLEILFGPGVPDFANYLFRKATHLVVYGILGALAWRADRRRFVALALCLLVASADEWRQSETAARSGSAWDVLLDLIGASIAVFIVIPWIRARLAARRT